MNKIRDAQAALYRNGFKATPCPECGGPANHPPKSSACKRIKTMREDSE